jgi:hypothetical protein
MQQEFALTWSVVFNEGILAIPVVGHAETSEEVLYSVIPPPGLSAAWGLQKIQLVHVWEEKEPGRDPDEDIFYYSAVDAPRAF